MRFVWLAALDGGQVPVNPDQVCYLRPYPRREPATEIVFGAVAGGLHSLAVLGDGEDIAAALLGPEAVAQLARRREAEAAAAERGDRPAARPARRKPPS